MSELQAAYGPVIEFENEDGEIRYGRLTTTDSISSYSLVKEFHKTFGHPVADGPSVPNDDRTRLRLALILEEVLELADAMGFFTQEAREYIDKMVEHGPVAPTNIIEVADALGDIEYVVNGAALEYGVPLPAVVKEIHDSNMTKLGEDGKPIYREDGKVKKGPKYRAPNLIRILWPR